MSQRRPSPNAVVALRALVERFAFGELLAQLHHAQAADDEEAP